jgi:hypothetical protein
MFRAGSLRPERVSIHKESCGELPRRSEWMSFVPGLQKTKPKSESQRYTVTWYDTPTSTASSYYDTPDCTRAVSVLAQGALSTTSYRSCSSQDAAYRQRWHEL